MQASGAIYESFNYSNSTGVAAGSKHNQHGGGSNVICIDLNVTYTPGKYQDGNQGEIFKSDFVDYRRFCFLSHCLHCQLNRFR